MLRDGQIARIANVLCARAGIENAWVNGRPTNEVVRIQKERTRSSGELILVDIAFSVFNGYGKANVSDVIHVLDGQHLRMVGELLTAIGKSEEDGGDDAEAWLARYPAPATWTRSHGGTQRSAR